MPFLLSSVLIGIGLYVRVRLEESPEFARVTRVETVRRIPLLDAVRTGWHQMVLVSLSVLGVGIVFYVAAVFSLSYGTSVLKLVRGTMIPAFGVLTDRVGRKPVFVWSVVACLVAPFVFFPLSNTRNYGLMLLGFLILFVTYAASAAAFPTFFSLAFPTAIRFSGMAVSYNIGTVLGASLAPRISAALVEATGSWVAVAAYIGGASLISVVSGLLLRELPDPGTAASDERAAAWAKETA